VGQAVNILGLARLGDVARVAALRREAGASGVGTAGSVAAEKLLDLGCLAAAGAAWLALLVGNGKSMPASSLAPAALLALAGIVLLAWRGERWMGGLQAFLARSAQPVVRALAPRVGALAVGFAGLTQRRSLARATALSGLIWLNMGVTNWLLLNALNLPAAPALALSVLVVVTLGVAPNLTPASIGPAHWAATFALTLFGVERSHALAYAIVLHAVLTAVPLVVALGLGVWPRRAAISATVEPARR
jgi:uncharacterized membrane protein YbhN (UPF0104 family)